MATERGRAKQDILRATLHSRRIPERILYLKEQYADFPDFAEAVEMICTTSVHLETALEQLVLMLP